MIQQLYRHLAREFKLPVTKIDQTGTSIMLDESREASGSQVVWTFAKHVIIRTHPQHEERFRLKEASTA